MLSISAMRPSKRWMQFRDYLPLRKGPNAGGEMRRFEAASYADATRRIRSSAPGSARNTKENGRPGAGSTVGVDRKSTRLNSSHLVISYAVFCLKKKKRKPQHRDAHS